MSRLTKILMQVGSHEVLLSDTVDFAKKAKENGVEVRQTIYKGMFHVFQVVPSLPETKDVFKEIHDFLMHIYN